MKREGSGSVTSGRIPRSRSVPKLAFMGSYFEMHDDTIEIDRLSDGTELVPHSAYRGKLASVMGKCYGLVISITYRSGVGWEGGPFTFPW
jgi:hypothetical protein